MTIKDLLDVLKQHGKEMRVLYVEDEEMIRDNIRVVLTSIFSFVSTASNGKEGLSLYQEESYDLVITDILMPEMNGIKMIEAIKEINPSQRILVTSACEDGGYLVNLINLGVEQYILKPMRTEQMLQALLAAVENIYNTKIVQAFNLSIKHELAHQSTLLEQYKEVVDISMIVSKTDTNGRITYVNDAFCKVSGYSEEELLGKSHKLIRHPDEPSEVFKNLWETIKSKKIWTGTLKNLKKDGGYYIADATIKPILDAGGNIIEFISMRKDITPLYDLNEEIWHTQHEMLYLLGEVGETRSQETGSHVRRVAKYSQLLAQLHGLNTEDTKLLYSASPMHDIGKIGISDAILLKPSRLEEDEFETMKQHAVIGYEILKNSKRPLLQAAAIIAHEHHEKWDGSGYPRALAGEEIHIYGRITALVDVFDALSCNRVYKKAWPMNKTLDLISSERGKHFDPALVDLFMANLEQFLAIAEEYKD